MFFFFLLEGDLSITPDQSKHYYFLCYVFPPFSPPCVSVSRVPCHLYTPCPVYVYVSCVFYFMFCSCLCLPSQT